MLGEMDKSLERVNEKLDDIGRKLDRAGEAIKALCHQQTNLRLELEARQMAFMMDMAMDCRQKE